MKKIGFFDFMKEERNLGDNSIEYRAMGTDISSLFRSADVLIEEDVLKIPSVQSCIELTTGTIAQLPIYLYKENEDGEIERIFDDKREFLLNNEPNEFQNAYNFKKQIVKDYLLHGASYSAIERIGNKVDSIYAFPTKDMEVKKYIKNGYKITKAEIIYRGENSQTTFKPHELLSVLRDSYDGLTSKGVLHYGQDTFKAILSEIEYMEKIYKNGALPLGVLKTSGRLTEKAVERLRISWQNLYSGTNNAGKTVILEEGLDYTPLSLKPSEMSLKDNKQNNIGDVCRLFNMPESMVNGGSTKQYVSIEQNNIHFLQYTLSPILTALENSLNKNLLLESEKKQGYFFAFDTSEVLKTTEKEKYEAIKIALESGAISVNEARYKLNLKSLKDNIIKWTLGAVLYYPDTGEMKIPNMGIGIEGAESKVEVEKDGQNDNSISDNDKTSVQKSE